MILCEDWESDKATKRRINVLGVLSNVDSFEEPPFPLLVRELCVFLALTEARGQGTAQIVCRLEETGEVVFATPIRSVSFRNDPLEVIGVPFRIRDCPFPRAGMYVVEFRYNGLKLHECLLRLR
jgi:hypothetical protein